MIIITLFIVLILVPSRAQDQFENQQPSQCQSDLINIFTNNRTGDLIPMYKFSGKHPQDLGSIQDCEANGFKYFLMIVGIFGTALNQGICILKNCTAPDLNDFSSKMVIFLQNILKVPIQSISFVDVEEVSHQKLTTGACFAIALVSILVILGIAGSIIDIIINLKKTSPKQKKPQQSNENEGIQVQLLPEIQQNTSLISEQQQSEMIQSISSANNNNKLVINSFQEYDSKLESKNTKDQDSQIIPDPYVSLPSKNDKIQDEQHLITRIVRAFSYYSNFQKVFDNRAGEGAVNQNLKCLNGLRVIMIFWVIFGHSYLFNLSFISNYETTLQQLKKIPLPTFTYGGYFAVDVFFWLSGFLATYSILNQFQKMKTVKLALIPMSYLHRFIRVWPTYVFVIFFYWKLSYYFGSGPLFFYYSYGFKSCDVHWWQNMTFTDNLFSYVDASQYCFGWGWYLSNDFQFFLLTPIILIAYHKKKVIGLSLTLALFLTSLITAISVAHKNDYNIGYPCENSVPNLYQYPYFYIKPYIRIPTYLMGILFGFLYQSYIEKQALGLKIHHLATTNLKFKWATWISGLILMNSMIWFIYPQQSDALYYSQVIQELYVCFSRIIFVAGVNLLLLTSLFGNKDFFSYFFAAQFWAPIAKISFCLYLIHIPVMQFIIYSQFQLLYLNQWTILESAFGYTAISLVIALIFSLTIESPILNLEKEFLMKKIKKN